MRLISRGEMELSNRSKILTLPLNDVAFTVVIYVTIGIICGIPTPADHPRICILTLETTIMNICDIQMCDLTKYGNSFDHWVSDPPDSTGQYRTEHRPRLCWFLRPGDWLFGYVIPQQEDSLMAVHSPVGHPHIGHRNHWLLTENIHIERLELFT